MLKTNNGMGIFKEIPLNRRLFIEIDGPCSKYNGCIVEPSSLKSIYSEFE